MANPAPIEFEEVNNINTELETTGSGPALSDDIDRAIVESRYKQADHLQDPDGSELQSEDGFSERRLFEILLEHALKLSGGDYGFVLSPAGTGAYAEQFIKLSAALEKSKTDELQPCYDTLMNRRPDPMIQSVMRLRRSIHGKPTDIGLPMCLPGSHPPIRYFLMVPIESGVSRTSVLFLANPDRLVGEECDHHLMAELEALCQTLSAKQKAHAEHSDNHLKEFNDDNSARHYVQLMSASINAVVIVDPDGMITAFNPSAEGLFGRESIHALGICFDRYLPQEFLMPILKYAASFEFDGGLQEVVPVNRRSVAARCESGNVIHLTVSAYFTRLSEKVYTTFVFDHEAEVSDMPGDTGHQQFQALTNVAPVGILQLNADWTCEYANEMWCRLSGLSMDESIGDGWVDAIHAEDVVDALVDLREALSKSQIYSRNVRLQRPTGQVSWVTLSGTVMLNKMGHFTGCLLVLLDVTETHLASEELRFNATHDVLTGLANRSAFLDKLQERLNSSSRRISTTLFYLDLDGFKSINDTLGHDCGDELLRQVAGRLRSLVAPEDTCARLGGDEFTIIVSSVSTREDACALAEKIVRSFNNTFEVYDNKLYLSVSIGLAVADEQTSSSDAFIKQADTALYKAKASGRSRWVLYTREFRNEDQKRSMLHAMVRRATERREFSLVYQPQFRIDDESIVSFEALLRWEPEDIAVPDTQFLVDVLEDSGLINDVGQWVLETACLQFMQWHSMQLVPADCTISVNVSAAQLSLANFVTRLKLILQRCEMEPGMLNLEITESALIEKNSSCISVINQIKEMGVKLSLDDFGTGYASLSYLTRLPIDYLKIDKSFVTAMNSDESSRTIVMSVLALAGTLNIAVVAEGIEDRDVLEQLKQAKCEFGQGYLFSRAICAVELERLLVRNLPVPRDMIELV